jgi:hypothetical protein
MIYVNLLWLTPQSTDLVWLTPQYIYAQIFLFIYQPFVANATIHLYGKSFFLYTNLLWLSPQFIYRPFVAIATIHLDFIRYKRFILRI